MVFPRTPNSGEKGVAGLTDISSAKLNGSVSDSLDLSKEEAGLTWVLRSGGPA